jgi:hypothetical protein
MNKSLLKGTVLKAYVRINCALSLIEVALWKYCLLRGDWEVHRDSAKTCYDSMLPNFRWLIAGAFVLYHVYWEVNIILTRARGLTTVRVGAIYSYLISEYSPRIESPMTYDSACHVASSQWRRNEADWQDPSCQSLSVSVILSRALTPFSVGQLVGETASTTPYKREEQDRTAWHANTTSL